MQPFLPTLVSGIFVGSTYTVVAIGFALTFSALRVINLAHPDLFMIAMFVGLLTAGIVNNFWLVLIVAAVVVGILGLVLERVVLRPLTGADPLMPLIATAGVSLALQNTAQLIFGAGERPFPRLVPAARWTMGSLTVTSGQLAAFGTTVALMVFAYYFVNRTKWGLATRAVAESGQVAATFGVNVARVAQVTVGLSSVMAAMAGVAIGTLFGSASAYVGVLYALKSFVVMLVAGNRRIEGVIIVGIGLGVLEAITTAYISSSYRDAVAFIVLIAVLVVRPRGIWGSYER